MVDLTQTNDITAFIEQIKSLSVVDRLGKVDNEALKQNAELGRILSIIYNNRLYKNWGYTSFKQFCRANFNYSRTMIKVVMRVYNVMRYLWDTYQIDQTEYNEIGIMKLSLLLPYLVKCKNKEEVLNLLKLAKVKTYVKLRDDLRQQRRIMGFGILKVYEDRLVIRLGYGNLRGNVIGDRKTAPTDLDNKFVKFLVKEVVQGE